MPEQLRLFEETHIEEDCSQLTGVHKSSLFYGCTFKDLRGLTLQDCVLDQSRFTTDSLNEALGFTLTLACASFRDVEFSPLLFDLFLLMAYISRGNDEKRGKLLDVIGKTRAEALIRVLRHTE